MPPSFADLALGCTIWPSLRIALSFLRYHLSLRKVASYDLAADGREGYLSNFWCLIAAMTTISRQIQVPYTAAQMYALVNDVAAYPQFLPWCESSQVLREAGGQMDARIAMKVGSFRKSFATRNVNTPGEKIVVSLLDGPFKSLDGSWSFHDLPATTLADGSRVPGGSVIRLDMTFEFANKLIDMAIGPVFREIVRNLVGAFQARATAVYGQATVHEH
jgi:ribosome-associated toxin RatA of RatAB toxin-antitoxin module